MIKLILKHFFLLFLLLAGSVFYYLTMTTPGLQTDIKFVTKIVPGKLNIQSAQGKLFSDFELRGIFYQRDSQTINIKYAALSWNPIGLLMNKLIIYSINIDQATVIIPTLSKSSGTSDNQFDFFKKIFIKKAIFNQIFIKLADAKINVTGSLKNNWDLTWKIQIPKTETFLSETKGSLTASGNIGGPLHAPFIKATLLGKKLTYADQKINSLQGSLQANLFFKNTGFKPEITGTLNVSQINFPIPSLGITLQQINLTGTMTSSRQLNFSGNFQSGKGMARLEGFVNLNQADYPVVLKIKGTDLQAINLPEYHVNISPDVVLRFVKQNLQLQGTVIIPYAKIMPQNFSSTVTLPNEVVFVGSKKSEKLPFTTSLQLDLKITNPVHLKYHDLKANLGGNVHINQMPGTLVYAAGELYTKKGTYTAYGQKLTIQTGRLIYTGGPLMNPGLNISAVKKLKTINTGGNVSNFSGQTSLQAVYEGTQTMTVGVEVTGTLENPKLRLFSTPGMSQGDILSYLVFGFPQSEANKNQYGAILSALSSLNPNTSKMGNFTKGIEQKLGLTQLGVESVQVFNPNATSSSQSVISTPSFVVGKKLSNAISIHYSVGLFNPVSILNLRYELTKNWAIQSETSTLDNGADVLYSIERD
ncbi:MAG TPA: translocation/assembly module TamB domain-containing protein [Gammaproteobacteria bacterium]|nr:translocation/assembly module TamB domain-containing protein [Gammaproteobacteria bacterium]